MTLVWSIFAVILLGAFLYELITGRIKVRLWKTVSRDEEPELYWTIFALQIMGLLTGVALLLFLSTR